MPTNTEAPTYAELVHSAAKAMNKAKTADDIATLWKAHLALGHRTLGKLLMGQDPERIIAKHNDKE